MNKETRFQVKMIVATTILLVAVITISIFIMRFATVDALKAVVQDEAKNLAAVVAQNVNGDTHSLLKPGDEESENFQKIRDFFHKVQNASPDIIYVYSYKPHDENLVEFVVDGSYGHEDDAAKIGQVYQSTTPLMLESFVFYPTAEQDFVSDKWGTYISGYAPVRNSQGEIVGAVGVDILNTTVEAKEKYIVFAIHSVAGSIFIISMIMLTAFIFYVRRETRIIT